MSGPRRLYSIDIFRGMTIALMILVNNPGSWGHIYAPLRHAKWHGCTLTDLVFPFFLFLVGASMRFAFVKWHYYPSTTIYKHIFWRSISIFMASWLIHGVSIPRTFTDWVHEIPMKFWVGYTYQKSWKSYVSAKHQYKVFVQGRSRRRYR